MGLLDETIGDWTQAQLASFIRGLVQSDTSIIPSALNASSLTVGELNVQGDADFAYSMVDHIGQAGEGRRGKAVIVRPVGDYNTHVVMYWDALLNRWVSDPVVLSGYHFVGGASDTTEVTTYDIIDGTIYMPIPFRAMYVAGLEIQAKYIARVKTSNGAVACTVDLGCIVGDEGGNYGSVTMFGNNQSTTSTSFVILSPDWLTRPSVTLSDYMIIYPLFKSGTFGTSVSIDYTSVLARYVSLIV